MVTTRATLGSCAVAKVPIATNQGFKNIIFNKEMAYPDFYYYIFKNLAPEMKRRASGTTFLEISSRDFRNLEVPLPPINDQRRAVEVIDAVSAQERAVEASIAKLSRVLSGDMDRISNSLFKYKMGRIGDVFEVRSGLTLGPDRCSAGKKRSYLRVANVQRGHIDLSDLSITEELPGDDAKYTLKAGDLLVVEGHANRREIGRCALVTEKESGHLHQNHLFRLRTTSAVPDFTEIWLNSQTVGAYWNKRAATSSGLYTISRSDVESIPFPQVEIEDQKRFVDIFNHRKDAIKNEQTELIKLRALKQGVMDDLLEG